MRHGVGLLTLMLAGAASATEPAVSARDNAAPPPVQGKADAEPAAQTDARKPLDLRIGDIRNYMMPKEYLEAITRPDADENTVVVEGRRELAPMRRVERVPGGLMSLGYAVTNPLNAWRIFAPVVDARAAEPPSVVPKPIFRWGP